ncbi:acetyltransferase [Methylobacterium sp. ap11]|nr:acetyltransferase [Methylobacterium sp. ap11]
MLERGDRTVEALSLYSRAGFTPRDPFPPYRASTASAFLEKAV